MRRYKKLIFYFLSASIFLYEKMKKNIYKKEAVERAFNGFHYLCLWAAGLATGTTLTLLITLGFLNQRFAR